ncbi:MAG TPA: hypothetical protein VMI31_19025, partial [Fimbriimonadaceae bacterium]|nr:hypothetical protein [Fimbriimonadaceae bacterium]
MLLALLTLLQTPPAFMRSPDIHGDEVVYTCEGDLWLGDLKSRKAIRLTSDVGTEMDGRFSPDGAQIAFDSDKDGVREIYLMPTGGGAPKRLTYLDLFASMVCWKDSHTVVFRAANYPNFTAPALYEVDVNGGEPQRLPLEFASTATFAPDGNRFVFSRFQRFDNAWFRYHGGLSNPIWYGDLKNLSFKQIYDGPDSCEFPTWLGDRVYFSTQEHGSWFVESVKTDGSGLRKDTAASPYEIRYLMSDGKRLVYEHGLGMDVFDPANGKDTPVQFEMVSDLIHTLPFMVPAEADVQDSSIGPTGKRVLVEARGQIVSLPVKEGDAHVVLAKDGVRFRYPKYSPDGKKIAYVSDETGEMEVYVCDPDGSNQKQFTTGKDRQLGRLEWSPDSKTLAYTTSEGEIHLVDLATGKDTLAFKGALFADTACDFQFSPDSKWLVLNPLDIWLQMRTIWLYEIATRKLTEVSNGLVEDMSPRFSPDGKYLAFLSRRNLTVAGDEIMNQMDLQKDVKVYLLTLTKDLPSPLMPKDDEEGAAEPPKEEPKKPFKIDLDGLYDRFIELPVPPGLYDQLEFADGYVLVHDPDAKSVLSFDLKAKKTTTIAFGAPTMALSGDGKTVFVGFGPNLTTFDPKGENVVHVGFGGLQLRINPKAEWKEMYWDAWRVIRDYFYVPNLHGADWPAIGQKYAAMLPSVRSRDELNILIRWLQAELSISHSFLSSGDLRSLVQPAHPSFLGVDLVPAENGFYKIDHILRGMDFAASGSPADHGAKL